MAWDFKGTFNKSQLDRFVAFARAQKPDLAGRVIHLVSERLRIGALSFAYDANGVPATYIPDDDSYIAKLVAAYEVLGGDPFYDLNIRTKSQAVFVRAGDETTPAQVMSNGEIMGLPGQADAASAELMDNAREWVEDSIDYKRDYLERKIRRAVDYAEQLDDEINYIILVVSASDTEGSFENVYQGIVDLIGDPGYRAIYDDKGKDPMGKKVNAPFKPYSAGPDRAPDDLYGRDNTGALDPGETVA